MQNNNKQTALFVACMYGKDKCIDLLLDEINIVSSDNITPLMKAKEQFQMDND